MDAILIDRRLAGMFFLLLHGGEVLFYPAALGFGIAILSLVGCFWAQRRNLEWLKRSLMVIFIFFTIVGIFCLTIAFDEFQYRFK